MDRKQFRKEAYTTIIISAVSIAISLAGIVISIFVMLQ